MGAGPDVDDHGFVTDGADKTQEAKIVSRAEALITQIGEEYKTVFFGEYKRLMTARLGLRHFKESDVDQLFSEVLDTMETLELDFTHFFRRLSYIRSKDIATPTARKEKASIFFHKEGPPKGGKAAREKVAEWLEKWHTRITEDWGDGHDVSDASDEERMMGMKKVNPSFIPRGWILDEVIRRVEQGKERDVLNRIMHMSLHPFEEQWDGQVFNGSVYKGDAEEEQRWIGDVPRTERAMQCSCSS